MAQNLVVLKPNQLAELEIVTGQPVYLGMLGSAKVGEVWPAADERRLIVSIYPSHVIFVALDGKAAGRGFIQPKADFASDLRFAPGILGTRKAAFAKKLLEYELQFILGVVAVTSGVGFVAVAGTDLLRFYAQQRSQIPMWRKYLAAVLTARSVLKTNAPTLWDKLVSRAFAIAWHGAKSAVHLGGSDVLAKIPDSAVSNPQIIGRGLGMILGTIGSHVLNARMGALRLAWSILTKVATKTLSATAGAAKAVAQQHAAEAQALVKAMQDGGISLSSEDAQKIAEEVAAHGPQIKGALEELAKAFQ